jgi:hypothetical protein
MSAAPPGGNGTISLIVRLGQLSASAPVAPETSSTAAKAPERSREDMTGRTVVFLMIDDESVLPVIPARFRRDFAIISAMWDHVCYH